MEHIAPVLEFIALCLDVISIAILVIGVLICMKDFAQKYLFAKDKTKAIESLTAVRTTLGAFVLLSLEILIAADIIDSIVKPNFEDLLKLAVIVAIRTVISFFLTKEMAEAKELAKEHK